MPSLIDFDVGRNSPHTLSCSVTERTPGSNLDAIGFLALPIAFGVRNAGIIYQVIVMGEATKRLSSEFRTQHPEIPWKDIAGMRDILAHQYDRLNINTLWDVIKNDIPELLILLEPIVPNPMGEVNNE